MIVALLLQAAAGQHLPHDVWASLSISAPLAHTSETVEFLRGGTGAPVGDVILRRTSRRLDDAPRVTWATSRTCAGVREAIARWDALPMPSVVRPEDPESLVMDGEGYKIRFYGRYGAEFGTPMELSSNRGTPLSQWLSGTLSLLQPCWTDSRP